MNHAEIRKVVAELRQLGYKASDDGADLIVRLSLELAEHGKCTIDEDGEQVCTSPFGHRFECTGTAYGGDDERWHGEGRCLCIHCGADGDA